MAARSRPVDGRFGTVVVGIDGSPSSLDALEWTVRVQGGTGTVHAVHAVSPSLELAVAAIQLDSDEMLARRRRDLGTWTAGAGTGETKVVPHVVEEEPPLALIEVARTVGADAIIVGAHTQTLRSPRVVGRTITQLVQLAEVPVVIVPEGSDVARTGSVVVAVGRSERSRAALSWAADFASASGASLSLVSGGSSRPFFSVDGLLQLMAYYIDRGVLQTWAEEDLADLAQEIEDTSDGELEVSWSDPGKPRGPRLVEASADASLLVVEARPSAPVPTWLHHAITHAPCPIVIVAARDADSAVDSAPGADR